MLQKTLGIVLHTLKYKDTSLIADIYTEVAGRASFMVSIPRSRKAAVKPVLFQPLALVELEADFRPNATIYKVKEAKSLYPFATLPYDPYKSAIALFLSEFLYRAVREEAARLTQLMRMNYETMHLFTMNRLERTRCLNIMNEYYRLHLPDFPVLKSLEVLKELFD